MAWTINDLREANPWATDLNDSELVAHVAQSKGYDPDKLAASIGMGGGVGRFVAETGKGLARGLVYGLPSMVNKIGAYVSPAGSDAERMFADGADSWDGWVPKQLRQDTAGAGTATRWFASGAESIPPSVAGMVATIANPVVGVPLVAGAYGSSGGWDSYKKVLDNGGSYANASAAGARSALVNGLGEGLGDIAGAKFIAGGARGLAALRRGGVDSAVKAATNPGWVRPFAASSLENAAVQSGTEYAQNYAQTAIENAYGAEYADPHASGVEGFGAGLAMSALMGPFGAGGHRRAAIQRGQMRDLLSDNTSSLADQHAAANTVRDVIQPQVGRPAADSWYNDFMAQQFAARNDAAAQAYQNMDFPLSPAQQADYVQPDMFGERGLAPAEVGVSQEYDGPMAQQDPRQYSLFGYNGAPTPQATLTEDRSVPYVSRVTPQGVFSSVDQTSGVKARDAAKAFEQPSGTYVSDPYNGGQERELTTGELSQFQAGDHQSVMDLWKAQAGVAPVQTVESQPRSQMAQRVEAKIKDAVSRGVIPQDHPAVQDWMASRKTTQDAVSTELAVDDVLSKSAPTQEVAVPSPAALQLAPVQQRVFDHIQQAINSGDTDAVVDAKGVLQYTKIGQALGMARGSAKSAVDSTLGKIARTAGIGVSDLKAKLRERTAAIRTTETADETRLGESPDQQASVVDEADLFGDDGAMQVVESLGGSKSAVGENVSPPGYVDSVEPSENARRAAEANRAAFIKEALEHPEAQNAALDWDDARSDGAPAFADLTETDKVGWISDYVELVNEDAKWATIEQRQREFENTLGDYDGGREETGVPEVPRGAQAALAGAEAASARAESRAGAAAPEARSDSTETTNPLEARAAQLREVTGEKQSARLDKLVDRYKSGDIDLDRLTEELQQLEEQAFPPERGGKGIQYSESSLRDGREYSAEEHDAADAWLNEFNAGAQQGQTSSELSASLKQAFPSQQKFDSAVGIVQSVEDLPPGAKGEASEASGRVQAFVDSTGKVWMIAGNITKGREMGVFLHEVGVHLGMEGLLGKQTFDALTRQIDAWAAQSGSQESTIAKQAIESANQSSSQDQQAEKLAYFVEHAVSAGVNPTAMRELSSPLKRWFSTLVNALKAALQKIGMRRFDTLTARDVVDLAYGAANLQLGRAKVAASNAEKIAYTESENAPREMSAKTRAKLIELYGGEKEYELFASQSDVFYRAAAAWLGTSRRAASTSIPLAQRLKERSNGIFQVLSRTGDFDSKRHTDEGIGQFKGYTTYAEEVSDEEGNTTISTFVVTDEQVARARAEAKQYGMSANDVLAEQGYTLKLDISADGEFSIHGPEYGTRFYKQLEAEGKVEEARGENGEIQRYADGSPWTALTGASFGQLTALLADVHARERIYSNVPHFGVKWKRATGATGKSDATGVLGRPGAIYFSEAATPAQAQARKIATQLAGRTGAMVSDDVAHAVTKMARNLMSLSDVVDSAKRKLPSATKWYEAVQNTMAERNRLAQAAETLAEQAARLPSSQLDAANAFIARSTVEQKWGYDPGFNRDVAVDPEMARAFAALSESAKTVVRGVFQHGEDMVTKKQEILNALGIDKLFETSGKLKGPYAPLKRFGNYVAVLKSQALLDAERSDDTKREEALKADGKHYVVSFFDTIGQARQFAEANAKDFALADAFEKSQLVGQQGSMPEGLLRKIMGALKVNDGVPQQARQAVEQMLQDMYFQTLDEHNARTSGLRRKNREGYDADMLRSFLSHARAEANFLANMKFGGTVNDAFYAMQREAKDSSGRRVGQDEFNILAEHYAKNLEHKETPIQDRVMALTSAWQLATSPAYHITNALQGVMVTVPRLAADFGNYARAWHHMMEGYRTLAHVGLTGELDLNKVRQAGLREALQRAADMGVLDVGMDSDLTQFEATRTGVGAVDKTTAVARRAMFLLRKISRKVEVWNRVSSATAAYNMALENGNTVAEAQDYAVRVLQTTQGDFSRTNAPLILKKLPKVMTQYKKYQFMMGALYVKAAHDAFRGETAEIRAIGRRMLAFKLFHASVGAGVLGLPLMNVVGLVLGAAFGDDDEPFDLERSLRDAIGDDDLANLVLHGPLNMIGLDMSAKLGEDKIFSIAPFSELKLDSSKGVAKTAFDIMAGPSGSQMGRFGNGVGYFEKGDYYRGLESFMPKGFADAMKAFRVANDGYTLNNGDVMFAPDEIGGFATTLNFFGLPTTSLKRMDWLRGQQYELTQFYTDRSREIQRDYKRAVAEGDTEAMSELRQAWMDLQDGKDRVRGVFNGSHDALRRQPLSTLLRYPQTSSAREKKIQLASPEL
jgi:hypothetical protein